MPAPVGHLRQGVRYSGHSREPCGHVPEEVQCSVDALGQRPVIGGIREQLPATGPLESDRISAEQANQFGQPFRPHADQVFQGMRSDGIEVVQPFSGTSETANPALRVVPPEERGERSNSRTEESGLARFRCNAVDMPTMPAPMTVKSTGWSKCSVSQYPVGILLRKVKVKHVEGSTEMPYFEDVAMRKPARMNGKNRMWLMHSVVCMMALALSVPSLLGQGSIEVDGTVRDKDTNQKLSGVEVTVLQDGQPYDVVRTLGNGRYTLSLDHGADYQLVFTYEDLSVRSVEVNTSTIPDAFRERPFFLNVEMSLFEVPPGFDQSLLDEPIGKVSFDESKEKLDWDLRYTRNMQNRIESALESAAESGGAEADEGGDAPAANRAYEEHMRKAEVEFGRGRYEQSINWLERALNEVPGDARAEAMMEEAVELQAEAEEAAAIDADYERLMREGKIQLKRKEWEAARTALESASELKPDEAEPRELLAEIPSGDTEEEVVSEPVQEEEQGEDDAASARADRAAQAAADAAAKKRPTAARSTSASFPRRTRVLTSRTTQRPRRCI